MNDLTLERRDKMRRAVAECAIPMGSTMWPVGGPTFLALLDAADERDRLAAAVERVRAIHAPSPVFMRADECGHDPEDHDEIESITGAVLCWDSPTGEFYCTACGGDPIDELPAHPCATIAALDGPHE